LKQLRLAKTRNPTRMESCLREQLSNFYWCNYQANNRIN